MKRFFKENWIYLLLGLLTLGLFFLRLYHLTILPVFADEAIYIRWAQVMKAEETLRFLPLSDGKEPLFMWIMILFFKFIHNPLSAGRVESVLSGLGTMIGVAYLSWLLFKNKQSLPSDGKKIALVAALIYAVSPFTFFFDRMALVDSMLSMFGIWTFIFAFLAFTKERLDFAMIAGFMLGGAWLTKSPALFFALMLPTLWLFAKWPKGSKDILFKLLKLLGLSLAIWIIGYGMYNILRLGPNYSLIASRNLDYVWPINHILTSPFDPLKPWLLQSWQWLVMMGPWGILVFGLIGIVVNWRKNWKELLILGIWLLGPIVIQSEYAKVLTARYILFSIPFLIVIAASSFTVVRKSLVWILVVILAFFTAQALIFDRWLLISPDNANLPRSERSGYLEEWTAGQGIYETSVFVRSQLMNTPKGKQIVVGTEGYFGTLPDGLEMYLNDVPGVTVIGIGLGFDHPSSQLVASYNSGNLTFLVVNKSRFGRDPENAGLKLIKEFPKAVTPNGTQDALLLMQVTNVYAK